jgi:DNA-directed RNA polymerase specialized sigma24 family protein
MAGARKREDRADASEAARGGGRPSALPSPAPGRDGLSDAELLSVERGTAEAFANFYRRHRGAVLVHLSTLVEDVQTALDVADEAFAMAYLRRSDYDPAGSSGRAWLLGIAEGLIRDGRRPSDTARRELGIPRLEYTGAAIGQAEALIETSRASYLDGLTGAERVAAVGCALDGPHFSEIIDRPISSPVAKKTFLGRALDKLTNRTTGDT